MSETAEKLKAVLLELPADERLEMADFLYASVPATGTPPDDDSAFDATLNRRIEEMDSGRVRGVPAAEVMRRLREKYRR